ncbi:MAG: hypothetical protein CFH41_00820 [Alphaproteobacteria bacterium MarineAlpha11_Bin1]|nr:MAG: hypothetical protein CFH41_00820 [Alphaproteobacteria bacterium MarineAlpha11_Bin1]|tara:strand:- start:729 stop:1169 length:441 start_codon:yes stop_codon:yes gene_type:complete
MGKLINLGSAPPHDPMFGISRSNIVSRLTRKNWRRKAAGRAKDGRFLYVMVRLGEEEIDGKNQKRYYVRVHLGLPEDRSLNADFDKLTDALAYANGEDGAALASSTHMASADQIPEDRGADIYVSGFTGQGENRRHNFTLRLPTKV